jgi:hypothetical protein
VAGVGTAVLAVVLVELDEFEVLLTTVVELELVEEFVVLELSILRPPPVVVVFVDVVFEEAFAGAG